MTRDVNIDDLQKLADKQAENFARVQIELNKVMTFLQLLLNIQTHQLAEKFGKPYQEVETQMNQTLQNIQQDINQASVESMKLIAELQKKKKKKVLVS